LHIQYQTVEQSMRLSHDSIVVSAVLLNQRCRDIRAAFNYIRTTSFCEKTPLGVCPDSAGNDIWHSFIKK
jgi:hypothetical protein